MKTISAVLLSARCRIGSKIANILEAESVDVLINTECAAQVCEAAQTQLANIAILDLAIFSIEGLDLIRQLRAGNRELKIIVLTQQDPKHFSARYSRAGATVSLRVSGDVGGLAFILRAIRSGYAYFDYIKVPIKTRERSFANETDLIATLTDRELMVFQGLARNLSNTQIADHMNIGRRHISVHKTNIFEKMLFQSISQLQELAARNKLG